MATRNLARFLAILSLIYSEGSSVGSELSCIAPSSDTGATPVSAGQSLLQRKSSANSHEGDVVSGTSFKPDTENSLVASEALLGSSMGLMPVLPRVLRSKDNGSTLFYHLHIPKTGGTTVANLLVSDICTPFGSEIELHTWASNCNKTCEMGFTDNQFSCADPQRNTFEHNTFHWNMKRAEELKEKAAAKNILYVTTLRRGSERLVSQWVAELKYGAFVPPHGVEQYSMKSLQLFITGGNHTGKSWIAGQNPSLRNNLQVGQLASRPLWTTKNINPLSEADLEVAKQVLLTGQWVIGFTNCMPQFQEKLMEHARLVHRGAKDKVLPEQPSMMSSKHVAIDEETQKMLDQHCALDNALFDWAWSLAVSKKDPRFAGTC